MNCPYCQFEFRALAISDPGGVPAIAPLVCERCARISLLVEGQPRALGPGDLEQLRKAPIWPWLERAIDIVKSRNN